MSESTQLSPARAAQAEADTAAAAQEITGVGASDGDAALPDGTGLATDPTLAWLEPVIAAVYAAGAVIMQVYAQGQSVAVRAKTDQSPVTEADEQAEAVLMAALSALTPHIPVVAEEAAAAGNLPPVQDAFWLVDPLDGTREFLSRNGEFTVNVALIEAGEPVLGVVYAPALGRLFAGQRTLGAFVEEAGQRTPLRVRAVPAEGLTVISSRSHGDPAALAAFLQGRPIAQTRTTGSSLKICLVAAGEADLYPRLGRTMEWDIAAAHAVLLAAGGHLTQLDRQPLRYGKPDFANPHFMACGQLPAS